MSFKNGDIVIFKSSNLKMVVIDDDLKERSGKAHGYLECKYYIPNEIPDKDFRKANFKPEELELITKK